MPFALEYRLPQLLVRGRGERSLVKTTWIPLVLTLVNLGLLAYQAGSIAAANPATAAPILRGSGIEIVDSEGRLRAQLKLEAADASSKMPDGKIGYPENVIFRLITPDGKPRLKLTTSQEGSSLMLLGDSDTTHTILKAGAAQTSLLLRNTEANQRVLSP
jgi:hypothetical protein